MELFHNEYGSSFGIGYVGPTAIDYGETLSIDRSEQQPKKKKIQIHKNEKDMRRGWYCSWAKG